MPTQFPPLPLVLAVLVVGVHAPGAASAQRVTLEARAGMSPVVRTYRNALGSGKALGVAVSMRAGPTLAVRVDADVTTGFNRGTASPDIYTFMLGLETELLRAPRDGAPVRLTALMSGGMAQIRFGGGSLNPVNTIENAESTSKFRPTMSAGLRLGTDITGTLGVFGGVMGNAIVLGRYSNRPESRLGDHGGFLLSVPLVAGMRVRF